MYEILFFLLDDQQREHKMMMI